MQSRCFKLRGDCEYIVLIPQKVHSSEFRQIGCRPKSKLNKLTQINSPLKITLCIPMRLQRNELMLSFRQDSYEFCHQGAKTPVKDSEDIKVSQTRCYGAHLESTNEFSVRHHQFLLSSQINWLVSDFRGCSCIFCHQRPKETLKDSEDIKVSQTRCYGAHLVSTNEFSVWHHQLIPTVLANKLARI